MRRIRRALADVLLTAVAFWGLAVTAAFFFARSSLQDLRGRARLPGLDSAVQVYVDSFAIPHIFGASETDVYRAQGYLHASERLWQMELLHRTAQGRLAELFGGAALGLDRFIRTLDLWGAAGRSLDALPRQERRLLEAYAEGVNERLASWSGPLPPEFLLLHISPQEWEPRATLAIGKIMALDLTSWREELSRLSARSRVDSARYRYLEPGYPEWGPRILEPPPEPAESSPVALPPRLPTSAVSRAKPGPERSAPAGSAASGGRGFVEPSRGAASERWTELPGEGWDPIRFLSGLSLSASNSWAVAGVRSADGQPLLANDMHLALRAPSTWYVAALDATASGLHVAGLSLPGVPGIVVGYTRDVAWGFTNAMVDDMDFVVEAVNLDQSAYRHGSGWTPFVVREDTIRVRGRSHPVIHTIRKTVRGPVISDVLPGLGVTLSVMWTGRRPTTEMLGLRGMARATTAAAFDAAVRRFDSPNQNVIYATASREIGYRLSGTVPRRRGWDGSIPVSFELVEEGRWDVWPADSIPSLRNPPWGFLASANNLQARSLFGVIGTSYPTPFRARRIENRLSERSSWTVQSMGRLQLDTHSLFADRVIRRAVAAARRVGDDSVATLLASWDRRMELNSRAATVFQVWLQRLRELIAADEFRGARDDWAYFPTRALLRTLEDGGGPWVDDVGTKRIEALPELEDAAMRTARAVSAGRRWGQVHRERSVHPLGSVGWLDRIFGFNVGPYPVSGGPMTVRPDDPGLWRALDSASWMPPFISEYGPSERFIAEVRPGGGIGYFLLPTGQSGNPFSSHYRDMARRWPAGAPIPVPLDLESVRRQSAALLTLLPD
ncbi:MAG: penicillin acylase family protein [Gemmatimonadota bacterium]